MLCLCDMQYKASANVSTAVHDELISRTLRNGRQLRYKLDRTIAKLLPEVAGVFYSVLAFSEVGPYEDYKMYIRDPAGIVVMRICDPALRYAQMNSTTRAAYMLLPLHWHVNYSNY
jgi:hypothetical protein